MCPSRVALFAQGFFRVYRGREVLYLRLRVPPEAAQWLSNCCQTLPKSPQSSGFLRSSKEEAQRGLYLPSLQRPQHPSHPSTKPRAPILAPTTADLAAAMKRIGTAPRTASWES